MKHVNNLVIISDTHIGDGFGLCPPDGAKLDGGGQYAPSKLQRAVWAWWREFWDSWVPEVCHKEPYAVAIGGDIFEHRHHNSTSQVSQNLADQSKLAEHILGPVRERCHGRLYLVRGTEAHTGPAAETEEEFAQKIRAVPDETGNRSRFELRVKLGRGARVNLMHHIGTTGSANYESTAVMKELIDAYVEAGRWGRHPYDVVVRCHRHRFIEIRVPSARGYAFSIVTPGWQLKTPFCARVAGARMSTPQFGGVVIRQGDMDLYSRAYVRSVEPPREEVL